MDIITKWFLSHWWTQEFVKVGSDCWVLHPSNGTKPVGEGIAGDKPPQLITGDNIGRSLLLELIESDMQMVMVTKVYKKNTEMMYPEKNTFAKYLDDYVMSPAPSAKFVTWSTRYLVEKDDVH